MVKTASSSVSEILVLNRKNDFSDTQGYFYAFTIPLMSNVQCLINASVIPSTEHSKSLIHRTLML